MPLKNKINTVSVSIILLSALLYNIAFFFPGYFGFGALLSLGLVGWMLCTKSHFYYTWIWCIFGPSRSDQTLPKFCHPELVSGSLNKISSKYVFMDFINPWILKRVQDDKVQNNEHSTKQYLLNVKGGLLWGAMVFSAHFVWLPILLVGKIKSSLSFALLAYLFFVCYFSLTSAAWFGIMGRINRLLNSSWAKTSCFLLSCTSYFYLLENYALWFFGRVEGYPFLNPLIPLAGFKPLAKVLGFICCLSSNQINSYQINNIEFVYLKPEIISGEPDFIKYEYQIYKDLLELKLLERAEKQIIPFCVINVPNLPAPAVAFETLWRAGHGECFLQAAPFDTPRPSTKLGTRHSGRSFDRLRMSEAKKNVSNHAGIKFTANCINSVHGPVKELVILAPESTFPFPINKYQSAVELWSKAFPPQTKMLRTHMLMGTQVRLEGNMCAGKLCQSVCWLTQCRIRKFYVKRHCVPFVEKIPKLYHKVEVIRKIFLGDAVQFSRAKKLKQDNYFELNDKTVFIPQICSELFFTSSFKMFSDIAKEHGRDKQAFIVLFINDSWFVGYFKNILQNCAELKSLLSGVPLIYVGHEGLKYFIKES